MTAKESHIPAPAFALNRRRHTIQQRSSERIAPLAAPPLRQLLRVPLFFKLLLAGGAIVVGATFLCALLAFGLAGFLGEAASWTLLAAIPLGAAAVALPLQALVLRLALRPLTLLTEAAERVENGEMAGAGECEGRPRAGAGRGAAGARRLR